MKKNLMTTRPGDVDMVSGRGMGLGRVLGVDEASNLDPARHRPTRIRSTDGEPATWATLAKALRARLAPSGVAVFIKSARPGDEDSVRVIVEDASLRRLTTDNALAVEELLTEFAFDLSVLLGDPTSGEADEGEGR